MVWYYATRAPVSGEYLEQWYHSASIVGKKTAITNFSHYGDVDADGDGEVADNNIDECIDKGWVEMAPHERKRLYFKAQMQILKDLPAFGIRMGNHVLVRQPYIDSDSTIKRFSGSGLAGGRLVTIWISSGRTPNSRVRMAAIEGVQLAPWQ